MSKATAMGRPEMSLRLLLGLVLAAGLCGPIHAADLAADESVSREAAEGEGMTVLGIARRSDDEDPRVLTILPWQPPTLPRRPRTELPVEAPELLAPVDPLTLERHRRFRQTLDPDLDSNLSLY